MSKANASSKHLMPASLLTGQRTGLFHPLSYLAWLVSLIVCFFSTAGCDPGLPDQEREQWRGLTQLWNDDLPMTLLHYEGSSRGRSAWYRWQHLKVDMQSDVLIDLISKRLQNYSNELPNKDGKVEVLTEVSFGPEFFRKMGSDWLPKWWARDEQKGTLIKFFRNGQWHFVFVCSDRQEVFVWQMTS